MKCRTLVSAQGLGFQFENKSLGNIFRAVAAYFLVETVAFSTGEPGWRIRFRHKRSLNKIKLANFGSKLDNIEQSILYWHMISLTIC